MQAQEKEIVALFTDIRGFSHMFEVLPAERVYTFTNRYFKTASDILQKYRGNLNNIVGDGFFAIWNQNNSTDKAPFYAVRTALELRMALLRQNIQYKWESHFPLEVGIGVAMGSALQCRLGPADKFTDTVFGRPVILASRLGDLAKHNQILICKDLAKTTRKWSRTSKMPSREIQGFKKQINYYKLEGITDFLLKNGEKRRSSVTRFVIPAIIAMVLDKTGTRKPVILRDISPSGAGVEIVEKDDFNIKENDHVILDLKKFSFPSFSTLEGRVVRIRTLSQESSEERKLSQLGICFTDMSEEKKEVLKKFKIV